MFVLKAILIGYFVGIVIGKANLLSRITSGKGTAPLGEPSAKAKTNEFKDLKLKENLNLMNFGSVDACPCDPNICSQLDPIIYTDGLCSEDIDGGRWLTLLRHETESERASAFRKGKWLNYAEGFGDSSVGSASFWLGLRQVHRLTSTGRWQVLLKVKWDKEYFGDYNDPSNLKEDPLKGSTGYEIWNDFKVGPQSDDFRLSVSDTVKRIDVPKPSYPFYTFHGYNNGLQFSTQDRGPVQNCAYESVLSGEADGGGWWYRKEDACTASVCLTCDPFSKSKELWREDSKLHIPSQFVMAIRLMK